MAQKITRTWWGEQFLEALQQQMDPGRLSRGRAYAGPNRLLKFSITSNQIKATLRGNINPYFNVHKEPRYTVSIKLKTIDKTTWNAIIQDLTRNAAWISRLIMNEMPDNIERVFTQHQVNLLPGSHTNELSTDCSCPDWSNPCKHIAGAYYKVASLLDRDPFLLFELRGMGKSTLHQQLADSPLGKALLAQITQPDEISLEYATHRYTQPVYLRPQITTLKQFWHISPHLVAQSNTATTSVSAALIKKQGDYPPFWDQNSSFTQAMEGVYQRVAIKNKSAL